MTQCCKCTRRATAQSYGHDWMCTFHYRRLLAQKRIQRKLKKKGIKYEIPSRFR